MQKRIFMIGLIVLALLVFAIPASAATSVTAATIDYNPTSGGTICEFPQVSITMTVTGTFSADDGGGIDAYAVKLIDGRRASLFPPAGTSFSRGPREAGRADLRYFRAQTGSTSDTFTANIYHPSANPVRIEVYEVTNFVRNGVNSTGELGRLLYTRTYDAPCPGAGRPPDDRVADPLTGPVVVYARDNRQVPIEVWRILEDGEGELALTVSDSQLAAVPEEPAEAVRIAGTETGIEVFRLPSGQCQVNAPEADGSLYTLRFECPDVANVQPDTPADAGGQQPSGQLEGGGLPGAPVVVDTPGNLSNVAFDVYRLNSANEGELALRVTFAELNAVPEMPETNTRIDGLPDDSVVAYRLTTGECQVNATRAGSSDPYVFIFACPAQ